MRIDTHLREQFITYLWDWYANFGPSRRHFRSVDKMAKELECSNKALCSVIADINRDSILSFRGLNKDEYRLKRAPDTIVPSGLTGDYIIVAEAVSAELRKRWEGSIESKRFDFQKLSGSLGLNSDLVLWSLIELEAESIVISNKSSKLPHGIFVIQTAPPLHFKPSKFGVADRDELVEL